MQALFSKQHGLLPVYVRPNLPPSGPLANLFLLKYEGSILFTEAAG